MQQKRLKEWIAMTLVVFMAVGILPVRAEAATMTDLNGHWANGVIYQWIDNGYISGYPDGTFKPNNGISRAEFVTLANRIFSNGRVQNVTFSDLNTSHWAYTEIQKAVAAGYIKGDAAGTFRPNAPVSRQEAAAIIAQARNNSGANSSAAANYKDSGSIPVWSRNYISAVSSLGIMGGFPDGTFRPKSYMTRAEAVVALQKATPPVQNTDTVKNNLTLGQNDTTLTGKTIEGDLILSQELASRNVTLTDVVVKGKVIVYGGNTITAENCRFASVVLDKSGVTLDTKKKTTVEKLEFLKNGTITGEGYQNVVVNKDDISEAQINGTVKYLTLNGFSSVRLGTYARVKTLETTSSFGSSKITFVSGADVDQMLLHSKARIYGSGNIDVMTVYVSGVVSSIRPGELVRRDGASTPDYDNNWSSSGSGSHYYENLTLNYSFDGNGRDYDDVRITKSNVTVEDLRVNGDLTITRDVANGSVTLKDVDVRGNVYVYGGGPNSVTFTNCDIRGNLVSDVSDKATISSVKNDPVALKFSNDSQVRGTVQVRGNTILKPSRDSYRVDLGHVIVDASGSKQVNLDIYVNLTDLSLAHSTKLYLRDSAKVTNLLVNSYASNTQINMDRNTSVDVLQTNISLSASGSGTVNTIRTLEGSTVSVGGNINVGNRLYAVQSITLNKTKLELSTGQEEVLAATIAPANATDKTVTWSSSNAAVATVDNNGKVSAVGEGSAVITVKSRDQNKQATCQVTVSRGSVAVQSITMNTATLDLTKDTVGKLTAVIAPTNATNQKVVWSSSNIAIARVDQNGNVTAVKAGQAVITAKSAENSKLTATCTVTITDKIVPVESISLNKPATELTEGGKETLIVEIEPKNATNQEVNWSSNDSKVAKVNTEGEVEAVAAGKATITATVDGKTATCEVTVTAANIAVKSVSLNKSATELAEGEKETLIVEIEPKNATNQEVNWSSSNSEVAKVNTEGEVEAIAAGKATITATVDGKTATCEVTVTVPPASYSINQPKAAGVTKVALQYNEVPVALGDTVAVAYQAYSGNQKVKGKELLAVSIGSGIAVEKMDDKYIYIQAKSAGNYVLQIAAKEDAAVKASCTVQVVEAERQAITVSAQNKEIVTGKGGAVTFQVVKMNLKEDLNFTWLQKTPKGVKVTVSDNSIKMTIPKKLAAGEYKFQLKNADGSVTYDQVLIISKAN